MDSSLLSALILVGGLGLCAAQTKYCCTPDQWEGLHNSVAVTSNRNQIRMTTYLYYDYYNKRVAAFRNSSDSFGTTSLQLLWLYDSSTRMITTYTLDLETRICGVVKTNYPFHRYCVPDSAQKLADITLGASYDDLEASTYINTTASGLQTTYVFTKLLCIPVSHLITTNTGLYLVAEGFANIRLGISRTSVFDVPTECRGAKLVFKDEQQVFSATPFLFLSGKHFL